MFSSATFLVRSILICIICFWCLRFYICCAFKRRTEYLIFWANNGTDLKKVIPSIIYLNISKSNCDLFKVSCLRSLFSWCQKEPINLTVFILLPLKRRVLMAQVLTDRVRSWHDLKQALKIISRSYFLGQLLIHQQFNFSVRLVEQHMGMFCLVFANHCVPVRKFNELEPWVYFVIKRNLQFYGLSARYHFTVARTFSTDFFNF